MWNVKNRPFYHAMPLFAQENILVFQRVCGKSFCFYQTRRAS